MSNTTSTPDHAANTGYTPVFSGTVRTVVYIIGLVAVIVGLGVSTFGDPAVGDYITTAGGLLAAGFGVAYNPLRMAGKIG